MVLQTQAIAILVTISIQGHTVAVDIYSIEWDDLGMTWVGYSIMSPERKSYIIRVCVEWTSFRIAF